MTATEGQTVKDKIIESADEFFHRFGFYKTTMDDIAHKIHKVKGVLYYYFNSKEELYTEVIKRELNTVKDALRQIVSTDDDPVTKLENYIKVRYRMLNNAHNYHETLKADFREKYGFVESVRSDFDHFERAQFNKILKQGKEKGYFDLSEIDLTIDVIMILSKNLEIPLYIQGKYSEYEKIINEMISIIFNGLKKNCD